MSSGMKAHRRVKVPCVGIVAACILAHARMRDGYPREEIACRRICAAVIIICAGPYSRDVHEPSTQVGSICA